LIIKCEKCGKEYEIDSDEKLSDFECGCGGELSPKKMGGEPSKPLRVPNRSNIDEGSNKKDRNKKIGIAIGCIGFILVLIVGGMIFHNNSNNSSVSPGNTVTSIPNSTYTGNGVTFVYPAGWKQINDLYSPSRWGYPNPFVAYYEPLGNGNASYIETYFYIKKRDVGSLDEMLRIYRSNIASIGQTEVSEQNITINGMKAVELIKTWRTGDIQYRAMTVHIEAVPGSKYYRIGCVVPDSRYNQTLPQFKMVANSFKLI